LYTEIVGDSTHLRLRKADGSALGFHGYANAFAPTKFL